MRIVAGSARGRRIEAPKGVDVRPTTDRVREALFSAITPRLRDATVLDLFAGTGALGIEALSRGAKSAVFVEQSSTTVRILKRNIEVCGVTACARIFKREATTALRQLARTEIVFDLVFLDPPYQGPMLDKVLRILSGISLIHADTLIIAEHPLDKPPTLPRELAIVSTRHYGKTNLSFIENA